MQVDWKREIAQLVYIKQVLSEADKAHLYPHHLPKVGASSAQVEKCEKYLGFRLNSEHSEFLVCANGWDGFIQATNLFGTEDFVGSERFKAAESLLDVYEYNVFLDAGFARDYLFPLAASELDGDVFAMVKPDCPGAGKVLWFAGYLIDQYLSFSEFFLSMMDYNRMGIEKLKS